MFKLSLETNPYKTNETTNPTSATEGLDTAVGSGDASMTSENPSAESDPNSTESENISFDDLLSEYDSDGDAEVAEEGLDYFKKENREKRKAEKADKEQAEADKKAKQEKGSKLGSDIYSFIQVCRKRTGDFSMAPCTSEMEKLLDIRASLNRGDYDDYDKMYDKASDLMNSVNKKLSGLPLKAGEKGSAIYATESIDVLNNSDNEEDYSYMYDEDMSFDEFIEGAAEELSYTGPNIFELIAMESRREERRERKAEEKQAKKNAKELKKEEKVTEKDLTKRLKHLCKRLKSNLRRQCKKESDLDVKEKALNDAIKKFNAAINKMMIIGKDYGDKKITPDEYKVNMEHECSKLGTQLAALHITDVINVRDIIPQGKDAVVTTNELAAMNTFADQAREIIAAHRQYISDRSTPRTSEARELAVYESATRCKTGKCGTESCEEEGECIDIDDEFDYEDEDVDMEDPIIDAAYQSYIKAFDEEDGEIAQETKGERKRTPSDKPLTKKQYFFAMCKSRTITDKNKRKATIDGIKAGKYTADDLVDAGLLKKKAEESYNYKGMKVLTKEDEEKEKKKKKAAESLSSLLAAAKIDTDDDFSPAEESASSDKKLSSVNNKELLDIIKDANMLHSTYKTKSSSEAASVANELIRRIERLRDKLGDGDESLIKKLDVQKKKLNKLAAKASLKAANESLDFPDWDELDDDFSPAEESSTSSGSKKDTVWKDTYDALVEKAKTLKASADKKLSSGDTNRALNILQNAKATCEEIDDHLDNLDMEVYRQMTPNGDEKKSSMNNYRKTCRKEVDTLKLSIEKAIDNVKGKATESYNECFEDEDSDSIDKAFEGYLQSLRID